MFELLINSLFAIAVLASLAVAGTSLARTFAGARRANRQLAGCRDYMEVTIRTGATQVFTPYGEFAPLFTPARQSRQSCRSAPQQRSRRTQQQLAAA